jgi:LPXTG-motif cell wall-anchored protein
MLDRSIVRRVIAITLVFAAIAVLAFAAQTATVQAAPPAQDGDLKGDPTHGAYLFRVAEACGCHSEGGKGFLAGGLEFDLGPAGKVYARNITSDPETGIGNWTEEDIVKVLQTGHTPDGRQLFPVMPYAVFSGMTHQDQHDIAAFIKTAPPINNKVPDRQLNIPVPPVPLQQSPESAPTEGVARGKYIVTAIAQCSDCHTPTDAQGNPDFSKFLGGQQDFGPNITPDVDTGIGSWSQEQIYLLLKTGKRPDGSQVGGLMAQVIQEGFSHLTETDGFAIAAYLKTIPPVKSAAAAAPAPAPGEPAPPQTLPATGGDPYNIPLLSGLLALGALLFVGGVVVWRRARKT